MLRFGNAQHQTQIGKHNSENTNRTRSIRENTNWKKLVVEYNSKNTTREVHIEKYKSGSTIRKIKSVHTKQIVQIGKYKSEIQVGKYK